MCIAPMGLKNPKYTANKKNKGVVIPPSDSRLKWIEVGCGQCAECRQLKAEEWKMRLMEEVRTGRQGQFVTLTISEEWGQQLEKDAKTDDSEAIAKLAVKRFRERWRKQYGKSCRHFLVTELGHSGKYMDIKGKWRDKTQRLHMHGIIFEDEGLFGKMEWANNHNRKAGRKSETLDKIWKYGMTRVGYSGVNEKMVGYVIKYITKPDEEHKGYYGRILTSPGMGAGYTKTKYAQIKHKYKGEDTQKKYTYADGREKTVAQYWKRKLWTDKQREELRIIFENKEEYWIGGVKITKYEKDRERLNARREATKKHTELGLWAGKKIKYKWKNGEKIEDITSRTRRDAALPEDTVNNSISDFENENRYLRAGEEIVDMNTGEILQKQQHN